MFRFLTVCLFSVSTAVAQIQPVVSDNQGQGSIDWSQRFIIATGIGAPNPDFSQAAQRPAAIRAAQMIALRNALETVKGIYVNSSTTIANFMTQNDVISSNVNGYVKGFEQDGRTKYMDDGSVEITMKIPLDGIGGLEDMVLGLTISKQPAATPASVEAPKTAKAVVFTGLIIDCTGLKIKPALSPRVLDESGKEVYGSAYVSREWAIKNGIVGYSKAVQDAAKLVDRIGKTPGQIKAIKASGDNSTDIVISNADADDVRNAAANLKFLSECRVIFVID